VEATRLGKRGLIPSIPSPENSGNNLGEETPVVHFEQWEQDQTKEAHPQRRRLRKQEHSVFQPCELDHLGRATAT
jgi:fumarate hydratase class I